MLLVFWSPSRTSAFNGEMLMSSGVSEVFLVPPTRLLSYGPSLDDSVRLA